MRTDSAEHTSQCSIPAWGQFQRSALLAQAEWRLQLPRLPPHPRRSLAPHPHPRPHLHPSCPAPRPPGTANDLVCDVGSNLHCHPKWGNEQLLLTSSALRSVRDKSVGSLPLEAHLVTKAMISTTFWLDHSCALLLSHTWSGSSAAVWKPPSRPSSSSSVTRACWMMGSCRLKTHFAHATDSQRRI